MRLLRQIRTQDVVWLLFFSAFALCALQPDPRVIAVLFTFAAIQIVEPKVAVFASRRGVVTAIFCKLVLCYLLIGWTGGVDSSFYFTLFIPMLSAATSLSLLGTVLFAVLAIAEYLSFLLLLDWREQYIPPEEVKELCLRVVFLSTVAYLAHQLARASQVEARKYQVAAEQLREAEAAVRRSERLAALGQLTAGLAHELRNPLGTMKASAEMLLKNAAGENEIVRELSGYISTEVDRTNSLITRFLDFARPFRLRFEPADVGAIIDRAVTQLERHNPAFDVHVYKNYSPDVRPIPLDAEMMERVFYNLLLNAAQSSAPQGAITVKTRQVEGGVETAVIDRGSGIDPKNMESIFNPFFTTKADGIGLGLAIVSKIIDEHGGEMTVESELGSGTVFRVFLPSADRA